MMFFHFKDLKLELDQTANIDGKTANSVFSQTVHTHLLSI